MDLVSGFQTDLKLHGQLDVVKLLTHEIGCDPGLHGIHKHVYTYRELDLPPPPPPPFTP